MREYLPGVMAFLIVCYAITLSMLLFLDHVDILGVVIAVCTPLFYTTAMFLNRHFREWLLSFPRNDTK